MAPDVIRLQGLRGFGHHGVLPSERQDGQVFVIDVVLDVDVGGAAASDDLADTVDYAAVAADVIAIVEGDPVNLIETLADRIARTVLSRGPVRQATVTVHKPQAPVGVPFGDVSVTVTRR